MLPTDKYPNYNFVGVLIGARGNSQKRLEQETGCKISVKGRGMKRGRNNDPQPEDDEPTFVTVTAPDEETLKVRETWLSYIQLVVHDRVSLS